MNFNGKHLSLEDRKVIEQNICKGLRKFETAKELNKSQSTIGKEIKNNRKIRYSQIDTPPWQCKYFKECMVCTSKCIHFEESTFVGFSELITATVFSISYKSTILLFSLLILKKLSDE